MKKTLITDLENINTVDTEEYNEVKVLLYADFKGSIKELKEKYKKVSFISSEYFYNQTYKSMGKFFEENFLNNKLIFFHNKLISLKLYDLFFLKFIIENELNDNSLLVLCTKYDFYLKDLEISRNFNFYRTPKRLYKKYFKNIFYSFYLVFKSLLIFLLNFYKKPKKTKLLLLDYKEKKIIRPYLDYFDDYIFEDIHFKISFNSKLNFKNLVLFLKNSFKILFNSYNFNFSKELTYISVHALLKYAVLDSRYDCKTMVGAIDSNMGYDFLKIFTDSSKTKLICITHANHLYHFRVTYMSNPYNYYFVSSNYLKNIITSNQKINTGCQFVTIGYANYFKTIDKMKNKKIDKKYDIVYICDYYHALFSINPFSRDLNYKISQFLLKLSQKYKILVRPRSKDKYYEDMYAVLGNKVDYSLEDDRPSIYEDIKIAKLGIAAYTNGIKDGLLMKVPFIHINFIDLKTTYVDMAEEEDGLYMAKNEEEALNLVNNFFSNKLKPIDFDKLNKKYIDNGEYQIGKALEIINQELSR